MNTEAVATTVSRILAERASTDPIAVLPLAALRIAAQFASNDPVKTGINCINIRATGNGVRVESTNGHLAFRVDLTGEHNYAHADFETKVDPKPFLKNTRYGREVFLYADNTAKIIGGKTRQREILAILPAWRSEPASGTTFPNIDQIWPDFTTSIGCNIAFNATYLAQIAAIVKDYSPNAIMQIQSIAPTAAAQIAFQAEDGHFTLAESAGGKLSVLIMPVRVRNW
jgi:S-methylmethionine-dependent homocysteine/selenocysteine methylase